MNAPNSADNDAPVLRPNGKPYRRRKPPVLSLAYDEWNGDIPLVLRTHDADEARAILLAHHEPEDFYIDLDRPVKGWMRLGYGYDGPTWIDDPVRGMPVIEWDEPRRQTSVTPPAECDNYLPPLTCLTAPSSESGRCDKCVSRVTSPAEQGGAS